jgi:hypothetical protein
MNDSQNQQAFCRVDPMDDQVIFSRKTPQAGSKIIVAFASQVRKTGQQPETLGDSLDRKTRNLGTPARSRDVQPDVIKIGLSFRRDAEATHVLEF